MNCTQLNKHYFHIFSPSSADCFKTKIIRKVRSTDRSAHTSVHPKGDGDQRPQLPVLCSDICTKSESNPKCLSKSLDKKPQKARIRDKNPICDKARVFVQLQFGQVTILKIPATTYFAFNVVEFARLQSMFSAFY